MIITATLIAVALIEIRMMSRAKLFCGFRAIRRAMKGISLTVSDKSSICSKLIDCGGYIG
jgi:hypothetical protein